DAGLGRPRRPSVWTGSVGRHGLAAERHLDRAAVGEGELRLLVRGPGADRRDQRVGLVDGAVVDLGDDVARLETGLLRRAAGGDRAELGAALRGVLHLRADVGLHRLAGLDDRVRGAAGLVDRDGEPDADVAALG